MTWSDWAPVNLTTQGTKLQGVGIPDPSSTLSLLPLSALVVSTPLMLSVIVISVGGNVMVLMSYRRGCLLVDAHSLYLLNLAVSDLLISVVCMPLHLVSTLFSSGWPLGRVLCKIYTAVHLTLLNVTTFVLVLVALNSLFQANVGLRSTATEAKKKAYVLLTACWFLAVVVHVPEVVVRDAVRGYSRLPENVCKPEFFQSTGHVLFLQVWDFFLPVLVLSVVNTTLYFRLKRLSLAILAYSTTWQTQQKHNYEMEQTRGIRSVADIHITFTPKGDFNNSAAVTFHSSDECQEGKNFGNASTSGRQVGDHVQNDPAASVKKTPSWAASTSAVSLPERNASLAGKREKVSSDTYRRERHGKSKWFCRTKDAYAPTLSMSGVVMEGVPTTNSSEEQCADGRKKGDSNRVDDEEPRNRQLSLDRPRRLKRVAAILFTLVLILVLCWLPYSVAFLVSSVCDNCVHPILYGALVWVLYFKSCINPFLYAYNTFTFRNKFRRLLARVFPAKRLRRIPTDRVSNERASILNYNVETLN